MTTILEASATPADASRRQPTKTATQRDVAVPADFEVAPYVSGIGAHLAGPANVILQLSWPGVGYGVMNSRVKDGSAMRRPFKRSRTTFTYLALTLLGTDADRIAYRKQVDKQHRQVYSRRGEPTTYHAMDRGLQTWVAACLYYGTVDMYEKLHGPIPEKDADALYAFGARFGTGLQMRPEDWPEDRAAFAAYWEAGVAQARIDPAVAEHLLSLAALENFPTIFQTLLAPFMVFITTGFLPSVYREALSLPWNDRKQRKFDRWMRRIGWVDRHLPRVLRHFPFNLWLAENRLRRRLKLPLL